MVQYERGRATCPIIVRILKFLSKNTEEVAYIGIGVVRITHSKLLRQNPRDII